MRWDEELPFIVSKVKDTKFESNSQQLCKAIPGCKIVSKVKDTKFESNSQRACLRSSSVPIVSKVKDTKFESNSQPFQHKRPDRIYCF